MVALATAAFMLYFPYIWCRLRRESLSSYGLEWNITRKSSREVALALALTLAPLTVIAIHWPGQTLPRTIPLSGALPLALSGAVAAIVEETFYRGLLQTLLVPRLGTALGIGIVSALFAASHLIVHPHPLFLATFFPGLVMGFLRHRHGSVLPAILYHALGNLWSIWFFPTP